MTKTANRNNMIQGIGNDIVEVARMRKSIERQGQPFLSRIFTQRERDYCNQFKDSTPHFAGRFAAKEAIVKALGTGFSKKAHWQDIEILNDKRGKPSVFLSESLNHEFYDPILLVSISHTADYATAVAIWVSKRKGKQIAE